MVDDELLELVELEVRPAEQLRFSRGRHPDCDRFWAGRAMTANPKTPRGKMSGLTRSDLMDAVDAYIPTPERDVDKPFLMAVERRSRSQVAVRLAGLSRGKVKVGDSG